MLYYIINILKIVSEYYNIYNIIYFSREVKEKIKRKMESGKWEIKFRIGVGFLVIKYMKKMIFFLTFGC